MIWPICQFQESKSFKKTSFLVHIGTYIQGVPKKRGDMEIGTVSFIIQLYLNLGSTSFPVYKYLVHQLYFPYRNFSGKYNGAEKLNIEMYQETNQINNAYFIADLSTMGYP